MNFKKFYLPILSILFASGISLALIVTRLSPCLEYGSNSLCNFTSYLNLSFFYLSSFLLLTSIFTLVNFFFRNSFFSKDEINHHFNVSLRQGLLLSIFINICISFLQLQILKWWTSLLLLILIVLTEFLFLQRNN